MAIGTSDARRERLKIIVVSGLTIAVFALLYHFRSYDDNRLTSYKWVFDNVSIAGVFASICAALLMSYYLSNRGLPKAGVSALLAFLSGIAFWPEPEVIVDASRYFTQAKHLELFGIDYFMREWGHALEAWTDMPLVPAVYGLLFRFFGEHRIWVQLINAAMFSGTVCLTASIGRKLWDETIGNASALMLLSMPYLYTQVPLMLTDNASMFLLTASIYLFVAALSNGGAKRIVSCSLVLVLAMLSKYSVWLLMSAHAVVLAVYIIENKKYRVMLIKRALTVLGLTVLISLPLIIYKYDVFSAQMKLLMQYQRPGLERWQEGFLSCFLYQINPIVTVFAVLSVYAAYRERDLKYLVAAWLPLLVVLLQIKRMRYLMPVLPMVALTASYGLQSVKTQRLRDYLSLSSALVSMAIAFFAFLPYLKGNDLVNLQSAGRYINTLDVRSIDVHTFPIGSDVNPAVSVPLLDLYTNKKIVYTYSEGKRPAKEKLNKSSLRFTWTYKNPPYYKGAYGINEYSAAIASNKGLWSGRFKTGREPVAEFAGTQNIFRFAPKVYLYKKKPVADDL